MGTVKAWLFKTTETDPRGVRRWHSQAVLGFLFSSQTLYLEIMSNIQKSCKNKNSIKNSQIHFHSLSVFAFYPDSSINTSPCLLYGLHCGSLALKYTWSLSLKPP